MNAIDSYSFERDAVYASRFGTFSWAPFARKCSGEKPQHSYCAAPHGHADPDAIGLGALETFLRIRESQ